MFTVRLIEGLSSREGRLEILRDGVWGGVCATNHGTNTVNEVAAKAICSMLGFGYVYISDFLLTGTYLDLGPPVPAGTLGDELSPSSTIVGNTSDFIMSATATDTHCSHVFHERVPPRPLWPAPSSAFSFWSPVYY